LNIIEVRYTKSKDLQVAVSSNAPAKSVTLTASAIINGVPTTLGKLNYKSGENIYRTNFKVITPKPTSVTVTSSRGGTVSAVVP
jgi:hypothetical protein